MTIINCKQYYLDGHYLAPVIYKELDNTATKYIQYYETLTRYEKNVAMACKANADVFGTYGSLVGYTAGLVIGAAALPLGGEEFLNQSVKAGALYGYNIATMPIYAAIMTSVNIIDFMGEIPSQEL